MPAASRPLTIPRVVVALDQAEHSRDVLGPACRLAARFDATVSVLQVVGSDSERIRSKSYLDAVMGDLVPKWLRGPAMVSVVRGAQVPAVATTILHEADTEDALLMLSSHARGGIGQAVFGSVASQVLQQSERPVVVIGPNHVDEEPAADSRFVVCLDGSPYAERLVGVSTALAATLGMALWFVEVVAASDRAMAGDVLEAGYVDRIGRGVRGANWEVLHGRHPADELVGFTQRAPTGAVALATHGRSGLRRLTAGSVAMDVARRARCPLFIAGPAMSESAWAAAWTG